MQHIVSAATGKRNYRWIDRQVGAGSIVVFRPSSPYISTMIASSHISGPIAGRTGLALAVVLLAMVFSARAMADSSVRCSGKIVSLGATSQQVLDKCGRPDHRQSWQTSHDQYVRQFYDYEKERWILPKLIVGPIQMERWTYNFGSHKFIRYLVFQNGELIKIETGDKGSD